MSTPSKIAERLLEDLMMFMWFRGPLPEEGRALKTIQSYLEIHGEVRIVNEIPYRSKAKVNEDYDMVRTTIDIPINTWRQLKSKLQLKGPKKMTDEEKLIWKSFVG